MKMNHLVLTTLILSTACSFTRSESVRLTSVDVRPVTAGINLVPNGDFEAAGPDGFAEGWKWGTRWEANTSCIWDETTSVSGRRSLKITNSSPLESPYTGLLSLAKAIHIEPGKPYTLNVWIKSEDPGVASIVAGAGWRYRITIPATGGKWMPVSMTCLLDEADKNFEIFLQSESPTKGLWIDDIKLEPGSTANYSNLPDTANHDIQLWPQSRNVEIMADGGFSLPFLIRTDKAVSCEIEAGLSGSSEHISDRLQIEPGRSQVMINGSSTEAGYGPRVITLRLRDGKKELAAARTQVCFYSPGCTRAGLQALKQSLPEIKSRIDQLKSRGQDISYPMISYTVLENFVGYAQEDAGKGELKRASEALADMESIKKNLERQLTRALAGKLTLPSVPRWTGDTRPVIKSSSFIAPTTTPGKPDREIRPVFFTGYGHFSQARADMNKFPNYGINIIQTEIGPSSTLPAEDKVNDKPAQDLLELLERGRKAGVAVNLLISPHYVPQWVRDKINSKPGSNGYSLRDPISQEMLKRHIAALITPIKDHPALHSICLANEPTYFGDESVYAVADWHAWLRNHHGDIDTLNSRWGASFASFDEIKLPYAKGEDPKKPIGRWVDCVRWNQEFLASWYRMLADALHSAAPSLPVHMKVQTPTLLGPADVQMGNDPYLIGCINNINGNDSVNWYSFGGGEFAQSWMTNARGEDLQRSVSDSPVFDSENHIIGDREMRYFPAEPVRAALWQQAIHGQSATTIWVWERTFDRMSDFYGSIMHRPACAEAVGIVNCDMNRAAKEITALQQAPEQVAILHDTSALIYDGERYDTCAKNLYMALGFSGLKIGFITERQLEAGILPDAPVIFVPSATHLSNAAFQTLQGYRGQVVYVGSGDMLGYDEYDKPLKDHIIGRELSYRPGRTSALDIRNELPAMLPELGVNPQVELLDRSGKPVWGVEWKTAGTSEGLIVNLCNYLNTPVSFTLSVSGKQVKGLDILTGHQVNGAITLQPLEVELLRVH